MLKKRNNNTLSKKKMLKTNISKLKLPKCSQMIRSLDFVNLLSVEIINYYYRLDKLTKACLRPN